MDRIGLIGLGNIGSFYTRQLLKAGYPLTVLDLSAERVKAATEQGAQAARNPGDIADKSDIVILSLPDSPAVEAVMDGVDGIVNHLRPGQLVIDTGTSRPSTDIRYARLCEEKGAGLIDSPLTWRQPGQILMVGGTVENFERARPVLECLSYKYRHVGEVGRGQVVKMINQAVLAGRWGIYSECVELARHYDLDPRLLKDYLEFDIPDALFGDDFIMGGQLALHYKDMLYLLEMAHDSGAHIPLMSLIHEAFKRAWFAGDRRWFQAGIITYWREMNKKA